MHLHILGLSGTFMSALAIIAREAGFTVTGSDANCYPPVSQLLAEKNIKWTEGYEDTTDALKADCVIVGNVARRGMPVLEAVLNAGKHYTSGPQWLADHILTRYRVMAVAGTHGKTTTTSMLAYILHHAGLHPAYLIGGVASNFETSACLGKGDWFVIEADEYDSAFFDKRPKFMHYRPEVAILNNLEFDHADIYPNLDAIELQFKYFSRTMPGQGTLIKPRDDAALNRVVGERAYCNIEAISLSGDATWVAKVHDESGQSFQVLHQGRAVAEVNWSLIGRFNVENALAAIAASSHAGVEPKVAAAALEAFQPVKRRLEVKMARHDVTVYDDFAHHPTAMQKTIQALKQSGRHKRVLVAFEFASYTMRSGVHAQRIGEALAGVDAAFVLNPEQFDLSDIAATWTCPHEVCADTGVIIDALMGSVQAGDAILVMSNRGFDDIHARLVSRLEAWAQGER